MKKISLILIFLSVILCLFSCDMGTAPSKYKIVFEDYDGTILQEEKLNKGVVPTPPTNPIRTGYEFIGWDKEIIPVEKSETYVAVYKEVTDTFTIIWLDYNLDIIEKDESVQYGAIPSYDGPTPTKPGNESSYYEFVGWNEELLPITGNVTFIAQFKLVFYTYTVT